MALRTVNSIKNIAGKTVLLRIDTDVDIEKGKILDDTRLAASLPTIELLLKKGAEINIVGHLGRPKPVLSSKYKVSSINKMFSLKLIADWFSKILNTKYIIPNTIQVGDFSGWEVSDRVNLLENLRFYKGEEENDPQFSRELSLLGDVYVNEAFAVSHRAHASIVGVPKFLPSYAGLHLKKEVKELSKILTEPKRPLAVLIGGAKIETKLPLVSKMHRIADYVLVGGEIAEQTRILIKVQHEKIQGKKSMVLVADMVESGLNITPKSVENFKQVLGSAGTIVWNGPVGKIRNSKFEIRNSEEDTEEGTRELAEFIVKTSAYKVVGGGDTLAFLRRLNLLSKFDFVSTGGGAMLEFLSGHALPGLTALSK